MITKFKDFIKIIWDKTNGFKTISGLTLLAIDLIIYELGYIDNNTFGMILNIASPIIGIGVIHRFIKLLPFLKALFETFKQDN